MDFDPFWQILGEVSTSNTIDRIYPRREKASLDCAFQILKRGKSFKSALLASVFMFRFFQSPHSVTEKLVQKYPTILSPDLVCHDQVSLPIFRAVVYHQFLTLVLVSQCHCHNLRDLIRQLRELVELVLSGGSSEPKKSQSTSTGKATPIEDSPKIDLLEKDLNKVSDVSVDTRTAFHGVTPESSCKLFIGGFVVD